MHTSYYSFKCMLSIMVNSCIVFSRLNEVHAWFVIYRSTCQRLLSWSHSLGSWSLSPLLLQEMAQCWHNQGVDHFGHWCHTPQWSGQRLYVSSWVELFNSSSTQELIWYTYMKGRCTDRIILWIGIICSCMELAARKVDNSLVKGPTRCKFSS